MESAHSSTNKMQLDDSTQEAHWEKQLSGLARVEGLVQKRKAELQRMDAVLIERRHELEDVVHKVCNFLYSSVMGKTVLSTEEDIYRRGQNIFMYANVISVDIIIGIEFNVALI